MKKDSDSSPSISDPNAARRARQLRRDATHAEQHLWSRLRNRRLGFKFRRQCPIGLYFADLCCKEAELIIEVDGDQHFSDKGQEHDAKRTAYLTESRYRVVRFSNSEVLLETEGVIEEILLFLKDPHRLARECETASPGTGRGP